MSSICHQIFPGACNLSAIVKFILNRFRIQFKNQSNGTVTEELPCLAAHGDILERYTIAPGCMINASNTNCFDLMIDILYLIYIL